MRQSHLFTKTRKEAKKEIIILFIGNFLDPYNSKN
jgi:hypothetical protein